MHVTRACPESIKEERYVDAVLYFAMRAEKFCTGLGGSRSTYNGRDVGRIDDEEECTEEHSYRISREREEMAIDRCERGYR